MGLLLNQLHIFLIMFGFGIFLGIIFDLYCRMIRKLKPGKSWISLADLSFTLLIGVTGFALLIFANWGELRFYIFLSILLGFAFHYNLLKLIKIGHN